MGYATELTVGDRKISAGTPSYFIADIAANHDGDLDRARDLIWLAKEAGADAAKFQHFLAKDIVSDTGFRALGGSQSHQAKWKKSVFDVYEQYHCPRDWTEELVHTCREAKIHFMTTPYDVAAIDMFAHLVPAYKIGSGDITWLEAVERIASKNKPVFLACGAASMADVERAVGAILQHNPHLALMQCNTNYTGSLDNLHFVNLRALQAFTARWPGMVLGLSDHTPGHATVLGAVTLGARVIEKHFTDDNSREGPDHGFAMNPRAWREMVERTRELEAALGDGTKKVEANEADTVIIQRRAIRARSALRPGQILTREDLEVLRPCPHDALPPYEMPKVVGRQLKAAKAKGDHLVWADIA